MHEQSHLVAGDAQGMDIAIGTQTRNGLIKSPTGLCIALEGNEGVGSHSLTDGHLILSAQTLLHLVGLCGVRERKFFLFQNMIYLRCHAMEHGEALGVIHLGGILDSL